MGELKKGLLENYGIGVDETLKNLVVNGKDLSKYTQYQKTVGTKGDFSTLKEAVDWFNASATSDVNIVLDSVSHQIIDTIVVNNSSHCLMISGLGICQSKMVAATGLTNKPMFQIKTHCDFSNLRFDGSTLVNYGTLTTENAINYDTTNNLYIEIQNSVIQNFYIGINDTAGTYIYLFNSIIQNMAEAGIRINTANKNQYLDCETNTFSNCNTGIDLLKSDEGGFYIINILFENETGQVCINYAGGASNYSYTGICMVSNCGYNLIGLFTSGFVFNGTESPVGRDRNIVLLNNQGIEDKKAHAKINVKDNATGTTITTAGTFYKAGFTNTSSYTCKLTIENNKITYQPKSSADVVMFLNASVSTNQTNRSVKIAVIKNGNIANGIFGEMIVRCPVLGQPYVISTVIYLEDVAENDYFELWVTSSSNSDVVTVDYLNWYTKQE